MKIVVFGLTISSSWGNGHATLWRGLCKALARQSHRVVFFERDVPYYAGARDYYEIPEGELVLYPQWDDVWHMAAAELRDADAAIVTSYCPDAIAAADLINWATRGLKVFYDLDTPITLARLGRGDTVSYLSSRGLADFDLVLSFTGGRALEALRDGLGARRVAPLYGHVDPEQHYPGHRQPHYQSDLSYLGTYSEDRQAGLEELFITPARLTRERRFLVAGAQYPHDFPWSPNVYFVRHLPPSEHPDFFCSSRLTLNVTRKAMAEMGWCPSGRLFEAAACGAPIISDCWDGLESFFTHGSEIIAARSTADVLAAFEFGDAELNRIGRAARERTLEEHTSDRRAAELISAMQSAKSRAPVPELAEA